MRKTVVMILTLLTFCAITAQAGQKNAKPQTDYCASDMNQLNAVIRSSFSDSLSPNYALRFLGFWRYSTYAPLEISMKKKFIIEGGVYLICPQTDGTFYIYKESKPSENATLSMINRKTIVLNDGTDGNLWWASDKQLQKLEGSQLAECKECGN